MAVTQPRASAGGGTPPSPTPLFSDGFSLNEEQKGQHGTISQHSPMSSGSEPGMPLFQGDAGNDRNIDSHSPDYPANYAPDNPYGIGNKPGASGNGEPEGRVGVHSVHGDVFGGSMPFGEINITPSPFGGDIDSGGDATWKNM